MYKNLDLFLEMHCALGTFKTLGMPGQSSVGSRPPFFLVGLKVLLPDIFISVCFIPGTTNMHTQVRNGADLA